MPRRGHSLPELTVVIVLTAMIAALGVPSLLHVTDRITVDTAARRLIEAHREARYHAMNSQRLTLLRIAADSIVLCTVAGRDTTWVWRRPGPRSFGVTVAGAPHTFRFIPYGYTIGASNTSYTLRRGAAVRKVIISRLGRVRVE